MSVVVFAYHDVGCTGLSTLVELGIPVAYVVTHDDDPVETVWFGSVRRTAAAHGIPVCSGVDPHAPHELARLRDTAPDAIFSFYYRNLLSAQVLRCARHGGVNLHGSLLPRYRGRAPVNWQILHGESQGGVTLHRMVARADAGDVIDREAVPIGPDDTPTDVYRRLVPATRTVLRRSARAVVDGTAVAARQLASNATTFPRRGPADGCIDWRMAATDVRNLVRAVTEPYPGAFTFAGSARLTVWWTDRARPAYAVDRRPGHVRVDADGYAAVLCGDGAELRLERAELNGTPLRGREIAAALEHRPHLTHTPRGTSSCTS